MSHSSKALQQREARDNSKAQKAEIEALQNKLAASEAREKETQQLLKEALEKIEYLTRKLFGRSTEARVVDGQLTMDILNEVEVITDKDPLEQAYETELVQFERKKKPKKTIEEKLKGLPVTTTCLGSYAFAVGRMFAGTFSMPFPRIRRGIYRIPQFRGLCIATSCSL